MEVGLVPCSDRLLCLPAELEATCASRQGGAIAIAGLAADMGRFGSVFGDFRCT